MWEEVARYDCKDDDGNSYTVIEREKPVIHRGQRLRGKKDWILPDKSGVNYIDAETFKVVSNDKVIRKV